MSNIMRNQLSLRLDRALIVRGKYFWEKMIRDRRDRKELKDKDPQSVFKKEMEMLNLREVMHPDTLTDTRSSILNDLRIGLNSMHIEKNKAGDNIVFCSSSVSIRAERAGSSSASASRARKEGT